MKIISFNLSKVMGSEAGAGPRIFNKLFLLIHAIEKYICKK
jgi:hypothetical protein